MRHTEQTAKLIIELSLIKNFERDYSLSDFISKFIYEVIHA